MTLEDYLTSPVANLSHVAEIEGLRVTCYTIGCGFEEYFPSVEDAEVGAEIHEQTNR